ncbi:MAG TPA: Clp protease N-terminal domain-containing protein, partial [Actinomycetota bacterium]|nr:Clp protease N-terminal domain-containing protein [Actinomycetota bacterium]
MDLNKLTLRSREAVTAAQRVASERAHQELLPEHLLHALLSDPEGVIYPLLHSLGVSPRALRDPLEERLERVPKVYGGAADVRMSRAASEALDRAFSEASALTDEYVSTEHLLL